MTAPERIEVGARVEFEALHLLGRHVGRAAGHALEPRDVGVRDQGDAEVDDAHVAVLRQQDVGRLDVAMDDAARMRVVQRLRALVDDGDDLVDRQQAAGAAVRAQRARAVHVLGDDVAAAVLLARVEDRHDVRVLQLADHLRFAQEHAAGVAALGVVADRGVVELDRDVAAVERIVRQVHRAGAAAAHLVHDVVLADALGRAAAAIASQVCVWTCGCTDDGASDRSADWLRSRVLLDDQQQGGGHDGCHYVVEHNSQPTAHSVIDLADRPGLPDVEQPEQPERQRRLPTRWPARPAASASSRPPRPTRSRMVVHAEPPRALAADPDALRWLRATVDRQGEPEAEGAIASPNSSPTIEPNVPGATGASPEPNPSASRWTGSRSNAAGTGIRSRLCPDQEAKWS